MVLTSQKWMISAFLSSDSRRTDSARTTGETSCMDRLRYTERTKLIAKTLSTVVPTIKSNRQAVNVRVFGYHALNDRNRADRRVANKSERGIVMFQRDPDALGEGKPAWRLFMQQDLSFGEH